MKTKRRILVVGGTAAGPSAAVKAARTNPAASVTLFEASETVSYGICESPYAVSGTIAEEARLVTYTPERLSAEKGIDVRSLHLVEEIAPAKHRITVRDLSRHSVTTFEYDSLILAMGSVPRRLGLKGEDARNVFRLRSREDAVGIMSFLRKEAPAKAVIIGAGYVGMEMAEALKARNIDTTVIHRHRLPLGGLEEGTRERVLAELESNGVQFVASAKAEALAPGSDSRIRHIVTDKGSFECGIVIVAVGVDPNVELSKAAKIRHGPTGAIAADERRETSADGIFAAGDCSEVKNLVTGKPMYMPLATYASRAGWVAGENAAGGRAVFRGAIRAIALKVFSLEIAHVGLNSAEAAQSGFQVRATSVTTDSRIALMPGNSKITIHMISDRATGRILGADVFGGEGAVHRANILSVAIQHRFTADDLSRLDLIYAPPFAPLWDPVLVAANRAGKKDNGTK